MNHHVYNARWALDDVMNYNLITIDKDKCPEAARFWQIMRGKIQLAIDDLDQSGEYETRGAEGRKAEVARKAMK